MLFWVWVSMILVGFLLVGFVGYSTHRHGHVWHFRTSIDSAIVAVGSVMNCIGLAKIIGIRDFMEANVIMQVCTCVGAGALLHGGWVIGRWIANKLNKADSQTF